MPGLVVRDKNLLKRWLEVPDLAIRERDLLTMWLEVPGLVVGRIFNEVVRSGWFGC